ncbi:dihydrofolate reductase family protein [Nonomuraea sp. NPDC050394]|uniref:dihydrofolate reductase family protein n=1 Tax=Nonomuraea sp. NPDC050394 TaxID=3364363 RepID=UPI0037A71C88
MRTILYASITPDGRLHRAEGGHRIPPAILMDFLAGAREAGNLIMGRGTFSLMAGPQELAGLDVVVLSRRRQDLEGAHVAASPAEALRHLEARGHGTALLSGGAATYAAFLKEGLVDEVRLNLLPSDGAPVRLLRARNLSDGTLQVAAAVSRA